VGIWGGMMGSGEGPIEFRAHEHAMSSKIRDVRPRAGRGARHYDGRGDRGVTETRAVNDG